MTARNKKEEPAKSIPMKFLDSSNLPGHETAQFEGGAEHPVSLAAIIVLTKNPHSALQARYGVHVETSLESAIENAKLLDTDEVFVVGGAQIYEEALPLADRLYLTLIDGTKEGDAFFPVYAHLFGKIVEEDAREWNGLKYRWRTLEKLSEHGLVLHLDTSEDRFNYKRGTQDIVEK